MKTKRKRPLLKSVVVVGLLGATLFIPPVFRSAVWVLLEEEAFRQGGYLEIGSIEGALWEPVVVRKIRWNTARALGGDLHVEAEQVQAVFNWNSLLPRSASGRFFESLAVKGLKMRWVPQTQAVTSQRPFYASWTLGEPMRFPRPAKIELGIAQWVAESGEVALKLEDTDLELSELAPGGVKAGRVTMKVRGWERNFRDVSGRTAIQGSAVQFGELQLMDGVKVERLVVDLGAVESGKVDLKELFALAFGGEVRIHGQLSPASNEVPLEISGTFSRIGVAPLAAFLGVTEAAGGTLENGDFGFRGSPVASERGTATLRLEAKNFQWESRQWDSLVVGAKLIDRRVQVPEFSLRQGHNQLVLNGDMQFPGAGESWWKSDFGMNVTARIDNLTELSALLLPEFKYTAGALTVDGAVRSQGGLLGGALIVTGSKLKWRNAPIEELNAAVKLDGNDIRILNAELVNRADLIRAKGVVHIGDAWWYQGEFRTAVGNLGNYADLLQPPLAPEPYAGELYVEWNGQGTTGAHEGRMSGRFEGLHPVKPRGNWPRPLHGDFLGKYGKGAIELESFTVGDDRVSLQSRLVVGKTGGRLEGLQFKQGSRVTAEGDFSIPESVWKAWPTLDWFKLLKADLPLEMRLRLDHLDLVELGRLPGMPAGVKGELTGDWESHGSLGNLTGKGAVAVQKMVLPVGEGLLSEVAANVEWKGRALEAQKLTWTSASGRYEGTGGLEWKDGQSGPSLNLQVVCPKAHWQNLGGVRFTVAGKTGGAEAATAGVSVLGRSEWKASGTLSQPALSGEILVSVVDFGGAPDLRWFWAEPGQSRKLVWSTGPAFLAKSKLQLRVSSGDGAAVAGTVGTARVDLQIGGLCAKPELQGEARFTLRGTAAGSVLEADPLLLRFGGGAAEPQIEVRAKGMAGKSAYGVTALGPLSRPLREYSAEAPLTIETVRGVFEEGKSW